MRRPAGFSVVLVEAHDFAKGTSSRATKLVHGGVRYLAQGNIALVREALHERTTLLHNAPHLAQPLPFVVPSYRYWEMPFYGAGLKMYDALAGKAGLGATEFLSRGETLACLPTVRTEGLKGGIKYWDGQFDDARLALALARTAASRGALVVNYCAATGLRHEDGKVVGLRCQDQETGVSHELKARCVINATGVWVDEFRQQDGEAIGRPVHAMVAPSQGVHLVVDRDFLPGDHALDGAQDRRRAGAVRRSLARQGDPGNHRYAPGRLGAGAPAVPRRTGIHPERVGALPDPRRRGAQDIRSLWVGLRPLVKPQGDDGEDTKQLSREHTVLVSRSGLVTVTGGKWTTYRAMAEDVLEKCFAKGLLQRAWPGVTANLTLIGGDGLAAGRPRISEAQGLHSFGSEAAAVLALAGAGPRAGRRPDRGHGPLRRAQRIRPHGRRRAGAALAPAVPGRPAGRFAGPGRGRHPGRGDGRRSPGCRVRAAGAALPHPAGLSRI